MKLFVKRVPIAVNAKSLFSSSVFKWKIRRISKKVWVLWFKESFWKEKIRIFVKSALKKW